MSKVDLTENRLRRDGSPILFPCWRSLPAFLRGHMPRTPLLVRHAMAVAASGMAAGWA
jgi:hypothetical protein